MGLKRGRGSDFVAYGTVRATHVRAVALLPVPNAVRMLTAS